MSDDDRPRDKPPCVVTSGVLLRDRVVDIPLPGTREFALDPANFFAHCFVRDVVADRRTRVETFQERVGVFLLRFHGLLGVAAMQVVVGVQDDWLALLALGDKETASRERTGAEFLRLIVELHPCAMVLLPFEILGRAEACRPNRLIAGGRSLHVGPVIGCGELDGGPVSAQGALDRPLLGCSFECHDVLFSFMIICVQPGV